jgi:hypothetical protein
MLFHGPSEIEKKFHGVKMMGYWNNGLKTLVLL